MSALLKTPVVELLRVSTADQAEDDRAGLPRQEEANRRTIERHNLDVISVVRLVDVSGASTMSAPEIQDMLQLIRVGTARGLVVADLDRLIRPDDWTAYGIFQPFKESGALIYLPDQVIDLNTQAGFLMSGLQSVIAGNELTQIKKRMLGAKEEKRRQGKCPQSEICLPTGVGYDRKTETWHYTPDAEKVREIFETFLAGEHNLRQIERTTGIHHKTIGNLLRNQIYIGWRVYDQKRAAERRVKTDGRRADRKKVARLESEIIRVQVIETPLISPDDFWRVQDILAQKRNGFTERRRSAHELFLFKGLLRCAVCGEPFYTGTGGHAGSRKDYYFCRQKKDTFRNKPGAQGCESHYMNRRVVEQTVTQFIAERMADKDYILAHVAKLFDNDGAARRDKELVTVQSQLASLDKSRKRAVTLHVDGILEREGLDAKLAEIARKKTQVEAKLSALSVPSSKSSIQELQKVAAKTAEAFALFPFWDMEYQRRFLRMESPQFWIGAGGVTRFALPVGQKLATRTGTGSWPRPA